MSLFGSQGRFEGPIALNAPSLAVHNGAAGVFGPIRGKRVMRVLGIETSCDETGVAVYDTERGLLADVLYSQVLRRRGEDNGQRAECLHTKKMALFAEQ